MELKVLEKYCMLRCNVFFFVGLKMSGWDAAARSFYQLQKEVMTELLHALLGELLCVEELTTSIHTALNIPADGSSIRAQMSCD